MPTSTFEESGLNRKKWCPPCLAIHPKRPSVKKKNFFSHGECYEQYHKGRYIDCSSRRIMTFPMGKLLSGYERPASQSYHLHLQSKSSDPSKTSCFRSYPLGLQLGQGPRNGIGPSRSAGMEEGYLLSPAPGQSQSLLRELPPPDRIFSVQTHPPPQER